MSAPLLDVFPAKATTPTGEHSTVRVLVTDDERAVMFYDSGPVGVTVIDQLSAARFVPTGGQAWTVSGEEGEWSVTRQGGCGCGNRLKRIGAADLLNLVPA